MRIWKYPLAVTDSQELRLPKGARVLSIQAQHAVPTLWALVDPQAKDTELWQFVTIGTGHLAPPDLAMFQFFSTYQLSGGTLVFHVFLRRAS